jgi:hypothetical protein
MSERRSEPRLHSEADLMAAVTSPRQNREEIVEALQRCKDWHSLLRCARVNGIGHQLAVVLVAEELLGAVPREAAPGLKTLAREAFVRDQMAVSALAAIGEAFEHADVPFILLKGLGLAERLYRRPHERVSVDIDILTPAVLHERADELLRALGYEAQYQSFYERHHFHVPYRSARDGCSTVELHWQVTKRDARVTFDVGQWWNGARPLRLRSGNILIPPPVEELLYLCHHAFVRGSPTMRSLADISRLRAQAGGEPFDVACRDGARQAGVTRFLCQALLLSARMWDGQTPGGGERGEARQWLVRNLLHPSTVAELGESTWWPFKKICYWALLDPARARSRDLLARAIGGRPTPGRAALRLCALATALALCSLPYRLFPARFRGE